MIPENECLIDHVYHVLARNFTVAIYRGQGEFMGPRTKFGQTYLDIELHWGLGAPHGTCRPQADLGPEPEFEDEDEKLKWLIARQDQLRDSFRKEAKELMQKASDEGWPTA